MDAPSIIEKLQKLRDLYHGLLALGVDQSRLVSDGDTRGLLDLLARRETLTGHAAEIEHALLEFKHDWPASAEAWDATDRDAARDLLRDVRDTLHALVRHDERDAAALRARTALAGSDLRRLRDDGRAARLVNRRYAHDANTRAAGRVDRSA